MKTNCSSFSFRPMLALLIIDMQKGSFTPSTPRYKTAKVISHINQVANVFREQSYPVIFIQHDGLSSGSFSKGSEEWELLDELDFKAGDLTIDKYTNDSFYNTLLMSTLQQLKIKDLFVTGCATDFCVDSTAKAALSLDFNVHMIEDAHTTADRPHLSAARIIEHYNYIWSNMMDGNSSISTLMTEEVINFVKSLKQEAV